MLKVVSYGDLTFAPDYSAGLAPGAEWGLPAVQVQVAKRSRAWPLMAEVGRPGATLNLLVHILGQDVRALRDALLRVLSPESETPERLVVADEDGQNQRYVLALAEEVHPVSTGKVAAASGFAVRMRVHGDVRWRSVVKTTDTWNITASGQTHAVTNPGSDEAYPIIRVKPTSAKSGGYAYRRWVAVVWKSANAASQYPVCMTLDTASLIGTGKMQADGDDLRVVVDGVERDRWLVGVGTTTTKIWVNLDFQPAIAMTLKTAIPASGSIASIEVNEDISKMPESGILLVDSEAFVYTSKVMSERKFTGVTRAAKGTSAAAHSAGTAVHWIQRDVWLMYGNPSAATPATDNRYRPAFDLSQSSNTSWHYTEFGDSNGLRAGRWGHWGNVVVTGNGGCYTATQRTLASGEYEVLGAWLDYLHGQAYGWYLQNPCGIVNVSWQNGLKRRAGDNFVVHCMHWPRGASWWSWHYNPPSPSAANTWESWSYSGSAFAVSDTIAIAAYFHPQDVEAGTVTATLNSAETPAVTVGDEQGGYYLDCILENTTTGDAIRLIMQMALGTELQVDCDSKVVTWLADGSRQMRALQVLGTPRTRWLRLAPGQNTLKFTDEGTTGVTVAIEFEPRWF